MQPGSNQTGDDNENSSDDQGPDDGAEIGSGPGSDTEKAKLYYVFPASFMPACRIGRDGCR